MQDLHTYFDTLNSALKTVSPADVDRASAILADAYQDDRTVFVIGNGQSATTASAFALDLTKQTRTPGLARRFRVLALTDNTAALTAWANDESYDAIFTEQLDGLFRPGDVVVAVSASGNSPNVLAAAGWARDHGGRVIALTGFEGGKIDALADVNLIVRIADYGHVETAHLAIMHYWVDLFREKLAQP